MYVYNQKRLILAQRWRLWRSESCSFWNLRESFWESLQPVREIHPLCYIRNRFLRDLPYKHQLKATSILNKMSPITSLSSFILFISTAYSQTYCGRDCTDCPDLASCDADSRCFFLVDGAGGCQLAGQCESDCSLCLDEASCAIGAGGECLYDPASQECYGRTCNTDCRNCLAGTDECENSRAPPFGCMSDDFNEFWYVYLPPMSSSYTLQQRTLIQKQCSQECTNTRAKYVCICVSNSDSHEHCVFT